FRIQLLPPRSPLFPYTTLFRSRQRAHLLGARHAEAVRLSGAARRRLAAFAFAVWRRRHARINRRPAALGRPLDAASRLHSRRREDRKSTRLNSSHVKISYAVFC